MYPDLYKAGRILLGRMIHNMGRCLGPKVRGSMAQRIKLGVVEGRGPRIRQDGESVGAFGTQRLDSRGIIMVQLRPQARQHYKGEV